MRREGIERGERREEREKRGRKGEGPREHVPHVSKNESLCTRVNDGTVGNNPSDT
jgi:hypothetical protein